MSESHPVDDNVILPSSAREEMLDAEGQRAAAEMVITEIQAETGDSKHWGSTLATFDRFRGNGTTAREDLSPEEKDQFKQAKAGLETAFGNGIPGVLEVYDEWNRARGVREAKKAQSTQQD